MIEALLGKVALQAIIGFFRKNPWAILPTLVIGAMPVILVVSLVFGLIGGLIKPVTAADDVKCSSRVSAVDSLFKDTDTTSYSNQRTNLYGEDCKNYADSTGFLSQFDYDGWFSITQDLDDLVGKPYNQAKIDDLRIRAIAATGVNMQGKGAIQDLKNRIKNEFDTIVAANKNKPTVWRALDDWAQQYLSQSLGPSGIGNKMVEAAKSKVGGPYVTIATSFNAKKQCYNGDGGECGFNCAGLVSWAWGQAMGGTTTAFTLPYGSISSTQLHDYIISNKLGYVVDNGAAQPGDIIFTLNKPGSFSGSYDHTALYTGQVANGRASTAPQYVEAANEDDGIRLTPGWWSSFYHVTVRLAAADADAANSASGTGDQGAQNKNAQVAQAYAKSLAASKYNWTDVQFKCLVPLWNGESGWQYNALNPTSDGNPNTSNPSTDAYGIAQAWPGSKYAQVASDWRTSYMTQIKWGLAYVKNSYGTPCDAWTKWQARNPHWY